MWATHVALGCFESSQPCRSPQMQTQIIMLSPYWSLTKQLWSFSAFFTLVLSLSWLACTFCTPRLISGISELPFWAVGTATRAECLGLHITMSVLSSELSPTSSAEKTDHQLMSLICRPEIMFPTAKVFWQCRNFRMVLDCWYTCMCRTLRLISDHSFYIICK